LKREILLKAKAPDISKGEFVAAKQQTMGVGYRRLREFELWSIKSENSGFVIAGCATAVREGIRIKAAAVFSAKIVEGVPRFDLFVLYLIPVLQNRKPIGDIYSSALDGRNARPTFYNEAK